MEKANKDDFMRMCLTEIKEDSVTFEFTFPEGVDLNWSEPLKVVFEKGKPITFVLGTKSTPKNKDTKPLTPDDIVV